MSTSTLTKDQKKSFVKTFTKGTKTFTITATVRYDDECGNGHNSFSINGDIYRGTSRTDHNFVTGGSIHDEIAKHFPELRPLIKWHLVSSDGPMHYLANTLFHASDVDHNGNTATTKKQIRNGRTGQLVWTLIGTSGLSNLVDADEKPAPITLDWAPAYHDSNGKERDLKAARSAAVWPDATDEELTAPDLLERLTARLPALMVEFQTAVESLGFTY